MSYLSWAIQLWNPFSVAANDFICSFPSSGTLGCSMNELTAYWCKKGGELLFSFHHHRQEAHLSDEAVCKTALATLVLLIIHKILHMGYYSMFTSVHIFPNLEITLYMIIGQLYNG